MATINGPFNFATSGSITAAIGSIYFCDQFTDKTGIPLCEPGQKELLGAYTGQSIIGAINEVMHSLVVTSGMVEQGGGGGIPEASGAVIKLNQGLAEYTLDTSAGSFTTTWTSCPFDSTVVEDSPFFSRSDGTITIGVNGLYRVSYGMNVDEISGNNRSTAASRALLNGSTVIPGSTSYMYSRNNAAGISTMTKSFLVALNASDTIQIQSRRNTGSNTFQHVTDSNLSIEFMRFL